MWLRWVVSNLLDHIAEDKARQVLAQTRQAVEPVVRRHAGLSERMPATDPRMSESCDVVVLCALGLESGGLVDRMTDVVSMECASFTERRGKWEGKDLVICESGVGCHAAAQATEDLVQALGPQWVVSVGFAAALTTGLRRGHIVMPHTLIDQQGSTLDIPFRLDDQAIRDQPALHVGPLLTVEQMVRDRREKEQLAERYGAIACDLETAAAAHVCARHQTRFMAVRIITDQLDDRLPVELEHLAAQGTVAGKLGAATRALFQRPAAVKDMWKLRETAIRASDRLAIFLGGVLPQLTGKQESSD